MTCFPGMYWVLRYHLRSTGGLTVLARLEIVAILVYYQPSYKTSHTMKPSEPLLLADGIYPAGKVDHTVDKLSADAGLLFSEA